METQCVKVKLKPNSKTKVLAWAKELNSRPSEVIETLVNEDVFVESVFLEEDEDSLFLIYYMKMESNEKAREAVMNSKFPIDAYHQNFKLETWESSKKLDLLIDFDRTIKP